MEEESENEFGRSFVDSDSDDEYPLRWKRAKKSNTTIPKEGVDRLSALSDSLLLYILSFLYTKEVVKTCLLSKRWQFLWTYISKFDLLENSLDFDKICTFVDWVGRMLAMCNGIHLNKFAVDFWYEKCFASNVNFWVHYLVKNKVKDITLSCRSVKELYELPQMLYSYSSLTSLTISYCAMSPGGAIEWGSLKSLSIDQVELSDCVMERILSCCPVLEFLNLTSFWGLTCLNICSPNLTTLVIDDWENCDEEESFVEISAPYVRVLSISEYVKGMRFRLKNVSSVVRAELDFYRLSTEECDIYTSPSTMIYINQLFQSLQFVEELELGHWCIEVLSMLELKGWKIPPSMRSCLTLNALGHEGSIPGILTILKSSLNLTTLVVKGTYVFDDEAYVITRDPAATYLVNGNLDLILYHLKTIKINSFTESVIDSQPMLRLVRLLLKSAKVLEKMAINVDEEEEDELVEFSRFSDTKDLGKIALKLLAFPRASPEAVVMVS